MDGMVALPLACQARHSLQVFIMLGISEIISEGSPAFDSTSVIALTGACHHLRCIFLNSLNTTALLPLLRALSDRLTSKRLQSEGCSPVPASWTVVLILGAWSGPRPEVGGCADTVEGAWGAELDDAPGSSGGSVYGCSGETDFDFRPKSGKGDPADEAACLTASASSAAPKSVPSGNCAWISVVGSFVAFFAGSLGCLPCLVVEPLFAMENCLHSPSS